MPTPLKSQVLIVGDELESLVCAIAAARLGLSVRVLRRSVHPWVGGLSTRGGLSYMDVTPSLLSPVFASVIEAAGLQRVALEANRCDAALRAAMAQQAPRLLLESGVKPTPLLAATPLPSGSRLQGVEDAETGRCFEADFYIDATPDASFVRSCGLPTQHGLGGLFGESPEVDALGVSPVFRIQGLSVSGLQAMEATLRAKSESLDLLQQCMPWLSAAERRQLVARPSFAGVDYLDILNPLLGAWYHRFRYPQGEVAYDAAPWWVDGGNVALLADGTLGFNGLVGRYPLDKQLSSSEEEAPLSPAVLAELARVEAFFKHWSGNPLLRVLPPETLYIRQTVRVASLQGLSGQALFEGGCPLEESIGSFSYWLDFRGVHAWEAYPEHHPFPKPRFRVGLKPHLLPDSSHLPNVAMLGRSCGYSPLSQSCCRIVQYNALVGEGLAASMAVLAGQGQTDFKTVSIPLVQAALRALGDQVGKPASPLSPELAGLPPLSLPPEFFASPLWQSDAQLLL